MSLGAFGDIYETFDDSCPEGGYVWVPRVRKEDSPAYYGSRCCAMFTRVAPYNYNYKVK